jgi:hypothetical protein
LVILEPLPYNQQYRLQFCRHQVHSPSLLMTLQIQVLHVQDRQQRDQCSRETTQYVKEAD